MKVKTTNLFHYTKSLKTLKLILLNGFWPRYCLEDTRNFNQNHEYLAYPMVCFCDIPLSKVSEHIKFYGYYGIGVTKEWAIKNNLNPVIYFGENSRYFTSFKKTLNFFEKHSNTVEAAPVTDDINMMISYHKPLSGNMVIKGKTVKKDFYLENEWRFIPSDINIPIFISKQEFDDPEELHDNNDYTRVISSLKLSPRDIRYIFVKHEKEIPSIIKFICDSFNQYSSEEIQILTSRIISIDTLVNDI